MSFYGNLHFSALIGTAYAVSITFYIDFFCVGKMKILFQYICIFYVNYKKRPLLHNLFKYNNIIMHCVMLDREDDDKIQHITRDLILK